MEKINNLWFDKNRIYIRTDADNVYSQPLEMFPVLLDASDEERLDYKIGRFGDDIRWVSLDEDIHISNFTENSNNLDCDNEIARIFKMFPQLNVSEIARTIGINKSLLSKYIYGIKKPSEKRKREIIDALHNLGQELIAV